ncbi:MAG: class I SAM-dependent methyltransferase [Gammaproteobacteria bacterium]|jgi:SAM-dependent methyltransferase|nr:class I SAM-dependent methyltransferase [Gammaproteobacteria bacterium]MBT3725640.1 class I SAM-dependent methyltransferase [Gammaproteobacteria bacterium]MBT4195667.1 class I SAM-dependent methyltransferase [Gammaproteobacteria bacterium]MBT4449193.1 class I SAM-dependent methyltransferase [Gammaproteobacteria bacterium]MBT4859335.1 class I SAM-dependent methyltransferase [Gammaproteobacteria bacterium]
MAKEVKVDSKEVGLVAGLNLFNFFLGTKDLHYGLWNDGLDVTVQNLPEAQKRYSDFLISHFPEDVKTILDVGCGAGGLATELLSRGYQVQGVSPSPLLSEAAQSQAGDDFKIHHGRFEDVKFSVNEKFDMVMFSESFQYITLNMVLDKAQSLLRPGGYIVICDFFKTDAPGKSVVGGGHKFIEFQKVLNDSGLNVLEEKDITKETAPNLDLVNQMGRDLLLPTMKLIGYTFKNNRPWLSKFFTWKFRKKLDKIDYKYLSGERNAESFAKYKIYKFYLLQRD